VCLLLNFIQTTPAGGPSWKRWYRRHSPHDLGAPTLTLTFLDRTLSTCESLLPPVSPVGQMKLGGTSSSFTVVQLRSSTALASTLMAVSFRFGSCHHLHLPRLTSGIRQLPPFSEIFGRPRITMLVRPRRMNFCGVLARICASRPVASLRQTGRRSGGFVLSFCNVLNKHLFPVPVTLCYHVVLAGQASSS
jgi:hypothetical protein